MTSLHMLTIIFNKFTSVPKGDNYLDALAVKRILLAGAMQPMNVSQVPGSKTQQSVEFVKKPAAPTNLLIYIYRWSIYLSLVGPLE